MTRPRVCLTLSVFYIRASQSNSEAWYVLVGSFLAVLCAFSWLPTKHTRTYITAVHRFSNRLLDEHSCSKTSPTG